MANSVLIPNDDSLVSSTSCNVRAVRNGLPLVDTELLKHKSSKSPSNKLAWGLGLKGDSKSRFIEEPPDKATCLYFRLGGVPRDLYERCCGLLQRLPILQLSRPIGFEPVLPKGRFTAAVDLNP